MTDENQNLLEKLYQQYNDPIKPLLAEIEALYEKFPLALYNEIRALNDHVARAYTAISDDVATQQIQKAYGHVNRITRDCYKFLNLYYRQEAEKFDKSLYSIEPRTSEEYKRMADYGALSDTATSLVEYAKRNEHLVTDEETYENFQKAYQAYIELHKFIVANQREIGLLKMKKIYKAIGSVVFSIITFILGCILTNNNAEIIMTFKQFFTH